MNDEARVRKMMDDALAGEPGGGPDLGVIVQEGARVRRRARWRAVGVGAVAVVAAACVTFGATRALQQGASSAGPVDPGLAGVASSPSAPPADMSRKTTDAVHAQLMAALSKHLPAGMKISEGSGPTTFHLTRADGSVTTISALSGPQTLAGLPNPCQRSRYTSDCQALSLPDGSHGWASVVDKGMRPGWVVSVAAVTLNGQVFGLGDGDTENLTPGRGGRPEAGTPLTEQQLTAMLTQPDVLAALKQVPTDEVTPVPAGSPHRP
ncbi:hypothetical protein [Streptomyces sp. RPT161]|uniref:hypothetical protein n=1 Tax=Streptomyces sp. RPT161 TaxID=3015993 RepID=UPI0022B90F00|nr:hypothetical protein [Streptomyces sp. RPT161]